MADPLSTMQAMTTSNVNAAVEGANDYHLLLACPSGIPSSLVRFSQKKARCVDWKLDPQRCGCGGILASQFASVVITYTCFVMLWRGRVESDIRFPVEIRIGFGED